MPMFRGRANRIHFVGIGGIGMSGIAELLVNLGYRVSGSDISSSDVTHRLGELGATIFEGHEEANIHGADVVVVSSAVRPTNPEVVGARQLRIPVIPRAEMLAELMRMKFGIAVAGSHGKTTTTSMLAVICAAAKLDPTVVVGGRLRSLGTSARLGQGDYLVAEADESDGSFLKLSPTIAIVTNIDPEHLDHYGSFDNLRTAFVDFINRVPFYGGAVLCFDDAAVRSILPKVDKPMLSYGLSVQAELRGHALHATERGVRFSVDLRGDPLGVVELPFPGKHNVRNALAAIGASLELEIPFEVTARALAEFDGVARRLEEVGIIDEITVVDDYGHHPTEVLATLSALRQSRARPLRVVFQPHRYTRTRDLFDEFLAAFDEADHVAITDIYPASEEPIDGISGKALVDAIAARGHRSVTHTGSLEDALDWMVQTAKPGEILLTLGAGSVSSLSRRFIEAKK